MKVRLGTFILILLIVSCTNSKKTIPMDGEIVLPEKPVEENLSVDTSKFKEKHAVEDTIVKSIPEKKVILVEEKEPIKEELIYVEIQTQYPGGQRMFDKFIEENYSCPRRCIDEAVYYDIDEVVYYGTKVLFTVDSLGYISSIDLLEQNKRCPEAAEELLRVLKLTKWRPGFANGHYCSNSMRLELVVRHRYRKCQIIKIELDRIEE